MNLLSVRTKDFHLINFFIDYYKNNNTARLLQSLGDQNLPYQVE